MSTLTASPAPTADDPSARIRAAQLDRRLRRRDHRARPAPAGHLEGDRRDPRRQRWHPAVPVPGAAGAVRFRAALGPDGAALGMMLLRQGRGRL